MKKSLSLEFEVFQDLTELNETEKQLLLSAEKASLLAYAPYSKFRVGAAVSTSAGNVVLGSNKENASFPAGICAERNAVSQTLDRFPNELITHVAIIANPENFEITEAVAPCGICRQFIAEIEIAQKSNMILLLATIGGSVIRLEGVQNLLPLQFYMKQLQS